jgi:flagellar basal-body rod modification protein FlgD
MTGITAVSPGGSSVRQASSDAERASLDHSAFLRLFIASMKNQDPMKPNDPSQTLSQLATFSNVEQSIKLNDKLDQLVASSTASVAASMVGKSITSLDGAIAGRVTGVQIDGAGLFAMLEDGQKLELSQGYQIMLP